MNSSTLHKVYAGVIAGVVVFALIVGRSWADHVKADAQRDATITEQKSNIAQQQSNIDALKKQIADGQDALKQQIADLQKQKATVVAQPAQIPDAFFQLLKQIVPNAAPIQQTAKVDPSKPDAPSAVLSNQNQIDLYSAAVACKQCSLEKQQLSDQTAKQAQIIADKDTQLDSKQRQLDAAMKAAKGGSVWQRTKRAFKYIAIGAGIGAVAVEATRR